MTPLLYVFLSPGEEDSANNMSRSIAFGLVSVITHLLFQCLAHKPDNIGKFIK